MTSRTPLFTGTDFITVATRAGSLLDGAPAAERLGS
jgi:hypothetical protein